MDKTEMNAENMRNTIENRADGSDKKGQPDNIISETFDVVVLGAGAAGLSACLELGSKKPHVKIALVSEQPSERAQSVMAAGGINAADVSRGDTPELHAAETQKAGRYLADAQAVKNLTKTAPKLIENLWQMGMAFSLNDKDEPDRRAFGGQSKKRTAYAASNTGKQLMHTLTQQVRRLEAAERVIRYTGWHFLKLSYSENSVYGCFLYDPLRDRFCFLRTDHVIVATGGMNGLFGNATGSVMNTGEVTASLFADGISIANGEMIQYHPTTVALPGKQMLISEAVRGEGGRLFILKDGKPCYFMEEKYPELGNLMPRDVVSREEWNLIQQGYEIFLDMRGMNASVYQKKLRGVIEDCQQFLKLDPRKEPIPVTPGIHYFMGGIRVDRMHRTERKGVYAAGECACQYHGANRLGGNSLLGALYGGMIAAQAVLEDMETSADVRNANIEIDFPTNMQEEDTGKKLQTDTQKETADKKFQTDRKKETADKRFHTDTQNEDEEISILTYTQGILHLNKILRQGLGILRDENSLQNALHQVEQLEAAVATRRLNGDWLEHLRLKNSLLLGEALLLSALERKESRGAHVRTDFPEEREEYQKMTVARYTPAQGITVIFSESNKQTSGSIAFSENHRQNPGNTILDKESGENAGMDAEGRCPGTQEEA